MIKIETMTDDASILSIIESTDYTTIDKLAPILDWTIISKLNLDEHFVRHFASYIDWDDDTGFTRWQCRNWDREFFQEFKVYIDWEYVCRCGVDYLNDLDFVNEYHEYLDWWVLSRHATEEIIRAYDHKICWEEVCTYLEISIHLIQDYEDNMDWDLISQNQTMTNVLVQEYGDRLDWGEVILDRTYVPYWLIIDNCKYLEAYEDAKNIQDLKILIQQNKNAITETTNLSEDISLHILSFL